MAEHQIQVNRLRSNTGEIGTEHKIRLLNNVGAADFDEDEYITKSAAEEIAGGVAPEFVDISIPAGSPIPFVIDYTLYPQFGRRPTMLVTQSMGSGVYKQLGESDVPREYTIAGSDITTIRIYGHDSGNGTTTIDNLILTLKK